MKYNAGSIIILKLVFLNYAHEGHEYFILSLFCRFSKMSPKKKQVKPIKRKNREKERMTKSRKGEKKTRKGRKVSERVKT